MEEEAARADREKDYEDNYYQGRKVGGMSKNRPKSVSKPQSSKSSSKNVKSSKGSSSKSPVKNGSLSKRPASNDTGSKKKKIKK